MRTRTCTASLIGRREENEDRVAILADRGLQLLVVADGMGGHEAGGEAAQAAVDAIVAAFSRFESGAVADFFRAAFAEAHRAVLALGEGMPIENRPRTTCVAALVDDAVVWFAHLGDSRAYLLRGDGIAARTRDHSHVERMVAAGELAEQRVHDHPLRNMVDRCLGGEPEDAGVDLGGPHVLEPGDVLLLCSDGFWDELDMAKVGTLLREATEPEATLEDLAAEACAVAGETADNATAAMLRVEG